MSDEYDADEIDLEDEDDERGTALVKNLRKQIKAQQKELAEARSVVNEFKAGQRKQTVADALKAAGADVRYAQFYTGEDSSGEAVQAWIASNAELFGIDTSDTGTDQATKDAAARISQASAQAPAPPLTGTLADLSARANSAANREEFRKVLAEAARFAPNA